MLEHLQLSESNTMKFSFSSAALTAIECVLESSADNEVVVCVCVCAFSEETSEDSERPPRSSSRLNLSDRDSADSRKTDRKSARVQTVRTKHIRTTSLSS